MSYPQFPGSPEGYPPGYVFPAPTPKKSRARIRMLVAVVAVAGLVLGLPLFAAWIKPVLPFLLPPDVLPKVLGPNDEYRMPWNSSGENSAGTPSDVDDVHPVSRKGWVMMLPPPVSPQFPAPPLPIPDNEKGAPMTVPPPQGQPYPQPGPENFPGAQYPGAQYPGAQYPPVMGSPFRIPEDERSGGLPQRRCLG